MPLDPKQQPPYYTTGTTPNLTPQKQYIAIIAQSGTNAPTATIITNNYTSTATWTRVGAGIYRLTFAQPEMITNKTITPPTTGTPTGPSIGLWGSLPLDHCYQVVRLSTTVIELTTNQVSTGNNVELSSIGAEILITIQTYQ